MNVPVVDVEKGINTIKLIFEEVMNHKATHFRSANLEKFRDNNNILNYIDFIQLLKVFNIAYPTVKLLKNLKFMKIENPLKMSLNIINDKLKKCKISTYEMTGDDLERAQREILFNPKLNLKTTLFQNCPNDEVSLKIFKKKIYNKII